MGSSSIPMKSLGSHLAEIGVLSLTECEDVRQFVRKHQKPGRIHLDEQTLEFKDLDKFKPPTKWNAVILLHSAKLGRLSLTNVSDARYDHLLKDLHNNQEIKLITVIAHDVDDFHEHSRKEQLYNLGSVQKSAFNYSENVIICNTLNAMHDEDSKILDKFFEKIYRAVTGTELLEPDSEEEHEVNQSTGNGRQNRNYFGGNICNFIRNCFEST